MGNTIEPTLDLLHGYINTTHITNLTPYYPSGNLPTPYPLVILSVLISLTISCYSCKSAIISMSNLKSSVSGVRDHPKSPWARKASLKETPIHDTELEDLHQKDVPKDNGRRNSFDPPPPYMSDTGSVRSVDRDSVQTVDSVQPVDRVFEVPISTPDATMTSAIPQEPIEDPEAPQKEPFWPDTPSRKIIFTILIIYSTFRAATAFIIQVQGLIDGHTSASAPSNLILLLVSIQILTANYSIPRPIRMVLTLDILLASAAFVITSFASFSKSQTYPAYAQLVLAGGTCPFYMSNCHWQTSHWDVVGCGNYTTLYDPDEDDDAAAPTGFFEPYVSNGSLNTKMNPLNMVEAISIVFGLIWLLTAIFQIYEMRYLVRPRKERRSRYVNGRAREPCGVAVMGMTVFFGIIGAFFGTFLSIGGHMSQALTPHHSVYMDGIGSAVNVNGTFTTDDFGDIYYSSADYWGNSTSWSDCFTLTSPTSENGFWSEWVEQNRASIYRIAAGV